MFETRTAATPCHLCHSTGRITDGYQHHGSECPLCSLHPCDDARYQPYCWQLSAVRGVAVRVRRVIETVGVEIREVA